jgi:MOSC domain-containing protein YiiM
MLVDAGEGSLRLAPSGVIKAVMSNSPTEAATQARVASLHLHPEKPGQPLQAIEAIELEAGKGIVGEPRYFARRSGHTGKPSRRQVSLIEREQIAEHAVALGLQNIPPGVVRANIETLGADLVKWVGQKVSIGTAVLHFYEPRKPCEKMDAICQGLRDLMEPNRQGVMAEVVQSGSIRVGDPVRVFIPLSSTEPPMNQDI